MTGGPFDSSPSPAAVAAIVVARHGGSRTADCVRALLAGVDAGVAVCVVRRADHEEAEAPCRPDARRHDLRCPDGGMARARNAGAAWAASASLLAFTDDDCVVTPTWLAEIVEPFARDPRVGVVFGTVRPAPYDPAHGFLPTCARGEPVLTRSVWGAPRVRGLAVSMAMRRAAWEALGGFDEQLGEGAPLRAGEEIDVVLRALRAGWFVYEAAGAAVIHAGLRPWSQAPRVVHDHLMGASAAVIKGLRLGQWRALAAGGRLVGRWAGSRPLGHVGFGSHRRARLGGFLTGVARGLATAVDRRRGHFRASAGAGRGAPPTPEPAAPAVSAEAPVLAQGVFGPVIADRAPAPLPPSPGGGQANRVSIVMPSWNGRPFLVRALTSLVARTTYPYELIVVDNGSTDGSKEFIREFLAAHPEVDARFIDHPDNRYFSRACIDGFRAASPDTRYLALYCNDVEAVHDRWLPDLVAALEPADTIAAGHAGVEPITDRQRGVFFSYDPVYPDPEVKRRLRELMGRPGARYIHLYGYCFLLKRSLLERTGLYLHTGPFTQYHSDWEWCLRFAAMGYRIAPLKIGVHHWHSISELRALYPEDYRDLVERLNDPATVAKYLEHGRPMYRRESGFGARYRSAGARAVERARRRLLGRDAGRP
jgi:GT2 family glycosyltransferase